MAINKTPLNKGAQFYQATTVSAHNSTSTALGSSETFTGEFEDVLGFHAVLMAVKTDQDYTVYADFSPDGTNVDSTLTYVGRAGVNEIHRLTISRRYFRIRIVNGSVAQTYLRAQVTYGPFDMLVSPANAVVQQDADAIIAKVMDTEFVIGGGFVSGMSIVAKYGRNPDIDTGSTPEDVWQNGGPYAGFPTGAAEQFMVVSTDITDTGDVYFYYLASFTSTDWQLAGPITLQGTTPVATGITGVRCHRSYYNSGLPTTLNAGAISIYHETTTSNIFSVISAGYGQSEQCVYTVPYGNRGIIKKVEIGAIGLTSMQAVYAIWYREYGQSPRLLRPATVGTSDDHRDIVYGGIALPALTDVAIRIISVSANNSSLYADIDIINIKENG